MRGSSNLVFLSFRDKCIYGVETWLTLWDKGAFRSGTITLLCHEIMPSLANRGCGSRTDSVLAEASADGGMRSLQAIGKLPS